MKPTSRPTPPKGKRGKRKKSIKVEDPPAFGVWAHREDMKDVHAWLRKIRASRYDRIERRRPKP